MRDPRRQVLAHRHRAELGMQAPFRQVGIGETKGVQSSEAFLPQLAEDGEELDRAIALWTR